ncbi:MAG TPA: hypothetical protein VFQ39_14545 [Longimicrobium sp.]|nr:hypothetical protein [Longimicrobium sp.]
MRKIRLNLEALDVESFEPDQAAGGRGTVRGLLTAYYQLCYEGDTWQASCTCEPTCSANTCYNCGSAACPPATGSLRTCTGNCCLIYDTIDSPAC